MWETFVGAEDIPWDLSPVAKYTENKRGPRLEPWGTPRYKSKENKAIKNLL